VLDASNTGRRREAAHLLRNRDQPSSRSCRGWIACAISARVPARPATQKKDKPRPGSGDGAYCTIDRSGRIFRAAPVPRATM
jgi:hypothetical protein